MRRGLNSLNSDSEDRAVIEDLKNQRKRENIGNSPRGIDCDKWKKSHGMINEIGPGSKYQERFGEYLYKQ